MLKKLVATCLVIMTITSSTTLAYAEGTYYTNLDKSITMAIDRDSNIRAIKSNIPAMEEGLRKAREGSKRVAELYDKYETYRNMYYDSEDAYDHLIDMDVGELMEEMSRLSVRIANSKNPTKIKQMLKEIDFITYSMMFNMEEPNLTQEQLYKKYIKTIETVEIQAQNEYDKALNNIDLIKSNLTVGVVSLYSGILDIEAALDVQNESLELRNKIQAELEAMLEQGLVSEFTVYKNRVETEMLEIEIRKLVLQKEGLKYSLKDLLGLEVNDTLNMLNTIGAAEFNRSTPISEYQRMAVDNSPVLEAMRIDLAYYQDTLELYKDNEGYDFGSEYEDLTYQIERFATRLQDAKWNLQGNVSYAIADLATLQETIEMNKISLKNALKQLEQGRLQLDLGLVKQTDIHQMELAVQAEKMSYSKAYRAYRSALVKMNMLLEYGLEYN